MHLAIMGSQGMLGKAFVSSSAHSFSVLEVNRNDFDFTIKERLLEFLNKKKPKIIINAAANINMVECENRADFVSRINVEFVQNLAKWCAMNDSLLIQISSDHFYDYGGDLAHKETDEIKIINEYANQKYLAEKIALQTCRCLVLRTSLLGYRYSGKNTLIEWVLKTIKNEGIINGFTDAYTSSIDVNSFVNITFLCISHGLTGCFNIGCSEVYSKYDLIKGIIAQLNIDGTILQKANIENLYPTRANCCGLDVTKIKNELGVSLPTLSMVIENLKIQENYNAI
jgi:dTDP-4-dehydrorhamnose reductase